MFSGFFGFSEVSCCCAHNDKLPLVMYLLTLKLSVTHFALAAHAEAVHGFGEALGAGFGSSSAF